MSAPRSIPSILYALRFLPHKLTGKNRFARWLINHCLPDGQADVFANGLTFRVPSTREPVAVELIAHGTYEPHLCAFLERKLKPESVFFDVGANVGVMSLCAAHLWCPNGRVVGFEASQKIFGYLEHNSRTNPHPGLHVLNRAVTSHTGQHLIFYDAPDEKFGMGSLVNRFNNTGVQVPTISLDEAALSLGIKRVDVIKVDVEGFELGVFQGAQKLLAQSPAPMIIFEFNDWAENNGTTQAGDAQRYLRQQGYTTLTLDALQRGDFSPQSVIEKGGADIVALRIDQ